MPWQRSGPNRTSLGKLLEMPDFCRPKSITGFMMEFHSSSVMVVAAAGYFRVDRMVVLRASQASFFSSPLAVR